ncbi:hypothetical protein ACH5RR_016286 [Cinchona calisaya]|uniref:Late blight resistance protein R1A-like N-terminal domain-containing protein n=1 Tax=Cinchona calisaya TaxID=153742 RepID=A0ABD2ZVL1_9GENT
MVSSCIDAILHDLEFLEKNLTKKQNDQLGMLKLELIFVRAFLLCSRKCCKDGCLKSHENKHVEDAVQKMQQRLEKGFSSNDSKKVVFDFRETINSFKEEIKELYFTSVDCILHCSSPATDELMEIIDSLLENLEDVRWSKPYDQPFYMVKAYNNVLPEFIESLEEKLTMFRNFICFVTWKGVGQEQLEELLTHFKVMAVNAALATYLCWFDRMDKIFLIFVQL